MSFPSQQIKQHDQLEVFLETIHIHISFHIHSVFKPVLTHILPFIFLMKSRMSRYRVQGFFSQGHFLSNLLLVVLSQIPTKFSQPSVLSHPN